MSSYSSGVSSVGLGVRGFVRMIHHRRHHQNHHRHQLREFSVQQLSWCSPKGTPVKNSPDGQAENEKEVSSSVDVLAESSRSLYVD
jgi:hypothetical protein